MIEDCKHVIVGFFAVMVRIIYYHVNRQYMMVPENKDFVEFYNNLIETNSKAKTYLHYYHLADYANSDHGTRVWYMNGERFDQDEALLKDVARSLSLGPSDTSPSFGVSCYGLLPGKRWKTVAETGSINYDLLQDTVAKEVKNTGIDRVCLVAIVNNI
jgi:hypothetical protein